MVTEFESKTTSNSSFSEMKATIAPHVILFCLFIYSRIINNLLLLLLLFIIIILFLFIYLL